MGQKNGCCSLLCISCHTGDWSPLLLPEMLTPKQESASPLTLPKVFPLTWEKGRGISQGFYALTGEWGSQVTAPGSTQSPGGLKPHLWAVPRALRTAAVFSWSVKRGQPGSRQASCLCGSWHGAGQCRRRRESCAFRKAHLDQLWGAEHVHISPALSQRTRPFALLQFLRGVWRLFLLGAELCTDTCRVLQSPRAMAVGIPAWLRAACPDQQQLPASALLPALGAAGEVWGSQQAWTLSLGVSYLLWHQQELGQARDTQLEVLFPCLEQRGPSQGQSGPAGPQMWPGPQCCGTGFEVAACGCRRDVALHPRGDGHTGTLPGHDPAPSLELQLAMAGLPPVILL